MVSPSGALPGKRQMGCRTAHGFNVVIADDNMLVGELAWRMYMLSLNAGLARKGSIVVYFLHVIAIV